MFNKLFAVAALVSLSALVGCAEAPSVEGEGDDGADVESVSSASTFIDTFASQQNLTLSGELPLCDSSTQKVTGADKAALFSIFGTSDPTCIPRTYNRGVGKPMQCRADLIQSGAICYRPCRAGYKMVAGVCWQTSCPSGFRDDGAMCAKPAAYGRGAGYAIWDEDKCESRHDQGCEKWGAMWYPKCREGYHNVGANICSPDCPRGMTDTGVSCLKKTYVQSSSNTTPISYSPWPALDTPIFTAPLDTCPADTVRENQLCYTPCLPGFKGNADYCTYSE